MNRLIQVVSYRLILRPYMFFQNIFGQVIHIVREIGISLTCLQSENHNRLVLEIR